MRARLAFAAALVTLLTATAAPAGTAHVPAVDLPAVGLPASPTDTVVENMPARAADPVRRATTPLTPIPYDFSCEIEETLDGVTRRYSTGAAGELGDEPVTFEADTAFVRENDRELERSYSCTIEIGRGMERDIANGPAVGAVIARVNTVGHGHSIVVDEQGRTIGVAGIRGGRRTLVSGERIVWTMQAGTDGSTWNVGRVHAASCFGLTLARATNAPLDAWCSHEEPDFGPPSQPKPEPKPHDKTFTGQVESVVRGGTPDPVEAEADRIVEMSGQIVDDVIPAKPSSPMPAPPEVPGAAMPPVTPVTPVTAVTGVTAVTAVLPTGGTDLSRRGDLNS
ncbi:MAG TPA: hypothetical protein VM841_05635 [Actinomycetota bacterium]|nr:hypothetical protein [Actinomycetota bacterium]